MGDGVGGTVVGARFGRIDRAGEVALEETKDGLEFAGVVDCDCESGVAEDLALEIVRCREELFRGGPQKGVGVAIAVASG